MADVTGATSDALRVLYRDFDRFDGARQAKSEALGFETRADAARYYADGIISPNDLRAVVESGVEGGYSESQVEAAEYLLANEDVLDALDEAADPNGGADDRIAEQDIIAFINANRGDADLHYSTIAIADAVEILQVGREESRIPGHDPKDDYDARLVFFASKVGELDEADAATLVREIARQDGNAHAHWLQAERLERLGPDGEGRIQQADLRAVLAQIPMLPSHLPEAPEDSVRFMSFNIGQGASRGEGRGTDFDELDQVAQIIADSDADIIAIQEIFGADYGELESHLQAIEDDRAAAEGRDARDVTITFSRASDKEWRYESGRYGHAGDGFGNAVVTYGPQEVIYGDDQPKLPQSGEDRRIMGVTTEVNGETVTIFNTHLSNQADGRAEQIEAAFDIVGEYADGPVIFAGDFNQRIDGSRASYSGEQLQGRDAFVEGIDESGLVDAGAGAGATGNWGYGSRIDYVLVGGGAEADATYRVDPGPSDHAALVTDIQL